MRNTTLTRAGARMLLAVCLTSAATILPTGSNAQTLQRIQSAGAINLGYVPDQIPFSFDSSDRMPDGYAVDLCRHVATAVEAQLNLPELAMNFTPVQPEQALQQLQNGNLDLLCGAFAETLRARERVSFSIPIYVTGVGALVRRDAPASLIRVLNGEVPHTGPTWRATINAGLANHTYAVREGDATEELLRERIATLGVIAKVVTVKTHEEGIEMVMRKQAQAFFADRTMLVSYVARQKNGGELMLIDRRFTLAPVALVLQRNDADFRLTVDAALSRLYRSGAYAATYTRHFGEPSNTARLLFEAYALP